MNTQIMKVLGESCILTWFDAQHEQARELVGQDALDRSIVYDRAHLAEIGVPLPADVSLSHAVLTFRERVQ